MCCLIHVKTPTGTTTIAVCPSCGTIKKSGKKSCCGRGGSWFENCGGTGNAKYPHTWYDGIQACKTRSPSKAVIGQHSNVAKHKFIDFSQSADIANDDTIVFQAIERNTPTLPMSVTTVSTHPSVSTRACANLSIITLHISLLFVTVFS